MDEILDNEKSIIATLKLRERDRSLERFVLSGFIEAFHKWEFSGDRSRIYNVLEREFYDQYCQDVSSKKERDALKKHGFDLIKRVTPDELRELYNISVTAVMQREHPERDMYSSLRDAYVGVLREFMQISEIAGFLNRYVLPRFKESPFIDYKNLRVIKDSVEDSEKKDAGIIGLYWFRDGLSRDECERFIESIAEKDRYRRVLHDRVKEWGYKCGMDDEDVLADIVESYYGDVLYSDYNSKKKEIIVCLGVGMVSDHNYDRESGQRYSVWEDSVHDDYAGEEGELSGYSLTMYGEWKQKAEEMCMAFIAGRISGEYHSQRDEKSFLDDTALFEEIRGENPDIPIFFGYQPSHCSHGKMVFAYVLHVPLDEIFRTHPDPEERLERLMKGIREKIYPPEE
ncbi:MAG: hypothetical protein ABIJ21_08280 [Nanoarchaeota archaeon]